MSLLHKLSQQGKGAAATKALSGSPAASTLGLVRRRTDDAAAASASAATATQRRSSDPGKSPSGAASRSSGGNDSHKTGESTGTHLNVTQPTLEGKETEVVTPGYAKANGETRSTSDVTGRLSLVADYSDSDADTDSNEG